ncbi:MAG: non-homologous end-joining DNA ligase [Gemmatimonadota bacterium]
MTRATNGAVRFGRRSVELTNTGKVLFPKAGYTKGDLIDYYDGVARHILRHLDRRPLTLQRFPDGISGEGFYQKKAGESIPSWVKRASVPLENGSHQDQVVADDRAALALLAQLATITLHVWLSRVPRLESPDRIVFDLDPADNTPFSALRRTARELRELLDEVGLAPHLMLTGSTGVHVWAPLRVGSGYDEVRGFARSVVEHLADRRPAELTTEVRKKKRQGRLFLDVARNALGQTAVAPYSVRARPEAPVATPLDWDELSDVDESGHYTISSIPHRLAQREDPWKGMGRHAAALSTAVDAWKRIRG